MSTREGKVILLEDLLEESCKIAMEIIEGKKCRTGKQGRSGPMK